MSECGLLEKKIIYPKLSYKLMGVLFKVHNNLGSSYKEKYYQRAIEEELRLQNIPFEKEKEIRIGYGNKGIGKYYLDFVIDGKIALEVKAVPFFKKDYLNQVLTYLDAAKLKLGIVANFRTERLTYRRLVNPRVKVE